MYGGSGVDRPAVDRERAGAQRSGVADLEQSAVERGAAAYRLVLLRVTPPWP